jgi:hypothetical protein
LRRKPHQEKIVKSFCGAFFKKRLPEGPPEASMLLDPIKIALASKQETQK